ncbi:YegP family protein [Thalassospira tepidiphila]|uniref:YegP family protein n=1 Tax=Thalassospira tepidiphila TaxID=393657 RepID=UPI0030C70183
MSSCKDRSGDTWEIYKSDDWRWRRTAPNGRIVGASTQGYSNKQDCIDNARRNGMTCTPS